MILVCSDNNCCYSALLVIVHLFISCASVLYRWFLCLAAELSLVDAGYILMPSWISPMLVYEAMAWLQSYSDDLFLGCQPDIIDSVGPTVSLPAAIAYSARSVSYTHLTLPTKRIV